jgi:carbamoyl-phosphate synthase large subunit
VSGTRIEEKRIIVTGAAGVIGNELLRLLVQKGAVVLSVDRYSLSGPGPGGGGKASCAIRKDLASDNLAELHEFKPHVVFHLAASFERSKESPDFWNRNWRDNILVTHRILDLVRETDLEVFIFASSYLVYSPHLYLGGRNMKLVYLKEDDPISPRNLCGAAKHYAERELAFVRDVCNSNVRTICARIFRVYGCGSRDVIGRWVKASLSGENLRVYNKENRFDFVYARDVAESLVRLVENAEAEGAVNVGSGVARSIEQVVDVLAERLSIDRSKIQDLGVKEPFEASCADLTRLKRLTGWAPPTDLRDGVDMMIGFERKRALGGIAHD